MGSAAQGSAVLFGAATHRHHDVDPAGAMNAVNAALATALGNLLDECSAGSEIWAQTSPWAWQQDAWPTGLRGGRTAACGPPTVISCRLRPVPEG
jgi:hypothetical protein